MKIARLLSGGVILLCSTSIVCAQFEEPRDGRESMLRSPGEIRSPFLSNLSQGFAHSFHAWDLSLVGLGAMSMYRPDERDDQIALSPLTVDQRISKSIARTDGGQSLGSSLMPARIQGTIFLGQLAVTALLDLTTDQKITAADYERPFVFAKTLLYTYGITEMSKNLISRARPDGSDNQSFFSGHTSGSFAASAFIYREMSDWIDGMEFTQRSPAASTVLKVAAFTGCYGWAAYVGYARIYDNKHYLSDVLVGAAVGTVVGNLMYDWHFGKTDNSATSFQISFIPSSQPAVGLTYKF